MTISAFSPIALDLSFLSASSGSAAAASASATATAAKRYAPTPPWDVRSTLARPDALVRAALSGHAFFDERAAQLDLAGASDDYRKLFAVYQGLNGLLGLANAAKAKGVSTALLTQYNKAFARGMSEAQTYLQGLKLDQVRFTQGAVKSSVATAGVAQASTHYAAKTFAASPGDAAAALQGQVRFDITVTRGHTDTAVPIDLDQMGDTPRTLGNVVMFINQQLAAAGVATRFATQRQAGAATTIAGKTTTAPDRWGLAVNTGRLEQVSFSAPQTAPAVYVTGVVGKAPSTSTTSATTTSTTSTTPARTDPQTGQLLKLQADGVTDDRLVAKTLEGGLVATHATAAAPDGGLYVLGDATSTVDGQAIKGTTDAVLQKYDSAGKLLWSRTLGAAGSASGLALAVDDDGRIAVGGQVSGALQGDSGRKGETDSFVTLYDPGGREVWTQRRAAVGDDHVTGLAFADDGTVLVQGQSQKTGGAATTQGAWLQGLTTGTDGKPKVAFDFSYASGSRNAPDGVVVSGSAAYVAGTEAGRAVVRCFSLDQTPPQLVATRDLGDLGGGSLAGIGLDDAGRVVVAGASFRTDLDAGTAIGSGGGGEDLFAAVLSPDLAPSADDHISWFGGAGNETATDMKVAGGQVWLLGAAKADLPGMPKLGDQDGVVVSFDTTTGALGYTRRFAGAAGMEAPTALTVVSDGASILDRLGLPTGGIGAAQSDRLVDATSLRAGDSFQVRTPGGTARKIVLEASDTLDTLAAKIRRAAGFAVTVATAQVDGRRQLQIKPAGNRQVAELIPGPGGRDALASLGLSAGLLRATVTVNGKTVSGDGKGEIYGLGFDPSLTLATPDAISHAVAQINGALSVVIGAYRDLKAAASPPDTTPKAATGTPPAYLKAQIANYSAALARLQGG